MKKTKSEEPVLKLWRSYIEVTRSCWNKHPELLASGFSILLRPTLAQGFTTFIKQHLRNLKKLVLFLLKNTTVPQFQKCDLILFGSSNKPSWMPAIEKLALSLSKCNFTCGILSLMDFKVIKTNNQNGNIESFNCSKYYDLLSYRIKSENIFVLFFKSLFSLLLLFKLSFFNKIHLFLFLLLNPFSVFFEIFFSLHRFYITNKLLNCCSPNFILVNNERSPVASELLLSKKAESIHKVLFTNEWPTIELLPLFSDEIWVWNSTIASGFSSLISHNTEKSINIVGVTELDFINEPLQKSNEYICLKKQLLNTKTIVFLSQAIPNRVNNSVTEKILSWLEIAANTCNDWQFLYKSRPGRNDIGIKGLSRLEHLPNFCIVNNDISLKHLLKIEEIKIVCAINSSGLVVAVGAGKIACRFETGIEGVMLYPALNEITVPIHSENEFIDFLSKYTEFSKDSFLTNKAGYFPYLGNTTERMQQLCIKHLK